MLRSTCRSSGPDGCVRLPAPPARPDPPTAARRVGGARPGPPPLRHRPLRKERGIPSSLNRNEPSRGNSPGEEETRSSARLAGIRPTGPMMASESASPKMADPGRPALGRPGTDRHSGRRRLARPRARRTARRKRRLAELSQVPKGRRRARRCPGETLTTAPASSSAAASTSAVSRRSAWASGVSSLPWRSSTNDGRVLSKRARSAPKSVALDTTTRSSSAAASRNRSLCRVRGRRRGGCRDRRRSADERRVGRGLASIRSFTQTSVRATRVHSPRRLRTRAWPGRLGVVGRGSRRARRRSFVLPPAGR